MLFHIPRSFFCTQCAAAGFMLIRSDPRTLFARYPPTGGRFQNPRSRNFGPPNKRTRVFFGRKRPGYAYSADPNSVNAGFGARKRPGYAHSADPNSVNAGFGIYPPAWGVILRSTWKLAR